VLVRRGCGTSDTPDCFLERVLVAEQAMPAFVRPIGMPDAASIRQELMHLDALFLVIESLVLDMSPRQGGENDEHARALAEPEERLPPIVVHGPSMRVIDGIHRVRAAIIRGERKKRFLAECITGHTKRPLRLRWA
jgi:hypothetical protein